MKIKKIALLAFTALTLAGVSSAYAFEVRPKNGASPEIEVNLNLLQQSGPSASDGSPFKEQVPADKNHRRHKRAKAKRHTSHAVKKAVNTAQCPPADAAVPLPIPVSPYTEKKINTAPQINVVEKKQPHNAKPPLIKDDMQEGFPVIVSSKKDAGKPSSKDNLPEISKLPSLDFPKTPSESKNPVPAAVKETPKPVSAVPPAPVMPKEVPKPAIVPPVTDSKPVAAPVMPALPSPAPIALKETVKPPVPLPLTDAKPVVVTPSLPPLAEIKSVPAPALPAPATPVAKESPKMPVMPAAEAVKEIPKPPLLPLAAESKPVAAPVIPALPPAANGKATAVPPAASQELPPIPDSPALAVSTGPAPDLQVAFGEAETDLPLTIAPKLDEIVAKMNQDKTARVNILAYASGPEALSVYPKRVSLARGIAVRNYLTNKGISVERVAAVKALGNKNEGGPANRVDIFIIK